MEAKANDSEKMEKEAKGGKKAKESKRKGKEAKRKKKGKGQKKKAYRMQGKMKNLIHLKIGGKCYKIRAKADKESIKRLK